VRRAAKKYLEQRSAACEALGRGLTATFNAFHDASHRSLEVCRLRDAFVALDFAVLSTYGWADLQLEHDWHETRMGRRFTICDSARREILGRLLGLNQERHAEEAKLGRNDTANKKSVRSGPKGKAPADGQGTLI
jgi:hypothetical protein